MSESKSSSLTQVETLSLTKEVTKEGEPRAPPKCRLPSIATSLHVYTVAASVHS